VTTGYWKTCPKFEAEIATAFELVTAQGSTDAVASLNPDAFVLGVFMAQIREAIQTQSCGVAAPLEAITMALHLASEPKRAAAAFVGLRDSVPIIVSLMTSDLLSTPHDVESCMALVCLLSKRLPTSTHWTQLKVPLLERCKEKATSIAVLTLAARFFTHVVTHDLRKLTPDDCDIATELIIASLEHSTHHDLVAALATFFGGLSKVAPITMIARTAVDDLIHLAKVYLADDNMLCTWFDLFGAMSSNALGSFEVVEAGVVELLMEGITAHPDNVRVARSFLRVLAAITAEPAHVISAMTHRGVSKAIFQLCQR
jgi:hypothetical protein